MATVKVRLLTTRASALGQVQEIGDVIELPKTEALEMLERGYAEPVAKTQTERAEKRVTKPRSNRATTK